MTTKIKKDEIINAIKNCVCLMRGTVILNDDYIATRDTVHVGGKNIEYEKFDVGTLTRMAVEIFILYMNEKQNFFEIASLSCEDLEYNGFDSSAIDGKTMKEIAHRMSEDYNENHFSLALKIIAEIIGVPHKKQTINTPPQT